MYSIHIAKGMLRLQQPEYAHSPWILATCSGRLVESFIILLDKFQASLTLQFSQLILLISR